jgi:DNA sulfur modification protein DndE
MKPPVETIRVSQRSKEILIKLKRNTGLDQWNVICRWSLCASLSRDSKPPLIKGIEDSNIEMSWKTFAGGLSDTLIAIVSLRAEIDGIEIKSDTAMSEYFRAHLERGISNIQNTKRISSLLTERSY